MVGDNAKIQPNHPVKAGAVKLLWRRTDRRFRV